MSDSTENGGRSGSIPPAEPAFLKSPAAIWVTSGALFVLFAALGFLSEGYFTDDDVSRYQSARIAFSHPDRLVGLWTRPAFMILYALPSQLGYAGVEVTTALVSALTCFFTWRAAQHLDEPHPFLAAAFVAFQPLFLLLSFSGLTEPLAALFAAISLERFFAGRDKTSAFFAALIPLARLEMSLALIVWGVLFLRKKKWAAIFILPLGVVAWNLGGALLTGDGLFLYHAVFQERERGIIDAPGALHYLRGVVYVFGPVLTFFLLLGLPGTLRNRSRVLLWVPPVMIFAYLSYSSAQTGSLQSAGYYRHLVSLSPFIALIGIHGFNEWFLRRTGRWQVLTMLVACALCYLLFSQVILNRYVAGTDKQYVGLIYFVVLTLLGLFSIVGRTWWARSAVRGVVVIGLVISMAGYVFGKHGLLKLNPEQSAVRDAGRWYLEQGYDGTVLSNHSLFHFEVGLNAYTAPPLTPATMDSVEVGSIALWEGHYGFKRGGVQLPGLESEREWRVLRRALGPERQFFTVALEKVAAPPSTRRPVPRSSFQHPLGFRWDLAATLPGWQFFEETEGLRLLRGEHAPLVGPTSGAEPGTEAEANSGSGEGFFLDIEMRRDFRRTLETAAYGRQMEKTLAGMADAEIVDSWVAESRRWHWVALRTSAWDSVVGTAAATDRSEALHLICRGPKGSLAWIRSQVPGWESSLEYPLPVGRASSH